MSQRGYFGIVIAGLKHPSNVGGIMRSAHAFGAAFIATAGKRYERDATDTTKASRHVPLLEFQTIEEAARAINAPFVAVEDAETLSGAPYGPGGIPASEWEPPGRCVYVVGPEDAGLSRFEMELLDPFVGSGTTVDVARRYGRHGIGIDLSEDYLAIAAERTRQLSLAVVGGR